MVLNLIVSRLRSMALTPEQFRSIGWNETPFRVVERSHEKLVIACEAISVANSTPCARELVFLQPRNEWASLWKPEVNDWVDHPDTQNPIGMRIEEATAKEAGKLRFSFGGHHQQGWARWGFTAEEVQINP